MPGRFVEKGADQLKCAADAVANRIAVTTDGKEAEVVNEDAARFEIELPPALRAQTPGIISPSHRGAAALFVVCAIYPEFTPTL
jgi:hypothetical protein